MPTYPKPGRRPKKRQPAHVPPATLEQITQRDGHVCSWLGYDTGRLVPQHRQGGMGGRAGKHQLSNVVWLDSLINGAIESDPEMQAEAKRRGVKISNHATDPSLIPMFHATHGWRLLGNGGSALTLTAAEAASWTGP